MKYCFQNQNNSNGVAKTPSESERIAMRSQIIGLWKNGVSKVKIAEELEIAVFTVKKWIKRFVLTLHDAH